MLNKIRYAHAAIRFASAAALAGAHIGCGTPARATTPADKAAAIETWKCGANVDERALARVLGGQAVEAVRPLYLKLAVRESNVQAAALSGVAMTVRPLPGMTAEELDRALECHGARATLGSVQTSPNDPFVLPGKTVDIDVHPAGDALGVSVMSPDSKAAHEILDRATQLHAQSR